MKNVDKDVVLKLIVMTVPLYWSASMSIVFDKHSSLRFDTQSNPYIAYVVDYGDNVNTETDTFALIS